MSRYLTLLLLVLTILLTCAFEKSDADHRPTPPAPKKLTLHDAVLLALRYNPAVINSEINRIVEKYNLVVARNQFELQYALNATSTATNIHSSSVGNSNSITSAITPSTHLNLASGATVTANMNNNLNSGGSGYNPGINLNLTQHLMRGFGQEITLTPLADAYDTERINQLNLRKTVMATITTVINDYYSIIQNQQNILTQKLALDNANQRLQQNTIKIKAGTIPPSDNVQAESDLAQAQLGYTTAQFSLIQAKLMLLNDIGLAPDENIIIDDHLESFNYPIPSMDQAKKIVLASDINYQVSLINYRIDHRTLKVAKDNERAQLDLSLSAGSGSASTGANNGGIQSITNGSNLNNSVALNLTIPIDDVQAQQATLGAKAKLQQDDNNLRTSAWLLETTTINALNNLKTLKEQIIIAQHALETQEKALALAEIKRKFGTGSALDITLQQTALTNARLNYTNTQITYLTSMIQFRQLLGKTLEDWHVQINY
jgi:outer membrane protein TolC